MPPWKVIMYVPSARAWTQAGTASWTETLMVDMVLVHAKPERISVGMISDGLRTNARISRTATL